MQPSSSHHYIRNYLFIVKVSATFCCMVKAKHSWFQIFIAFQHEHDKMPYGALVTGQSLQNQHDSLSNPLGEEHRCKAMSLFGMAPWRARPCPGRPGPSPEPASWGTAGSLCRHCTRRANVRQWNLTQFMKRSSLPLAALCCHTPRWLGEGCGAAARLVTAEHKKTGKTRPLKCSQAGRRNCNETSHRVCKADHCETTLKFLQCGNLLMLCWCGQQGDVQCISMVLCSDLERENTQQPRDLQGLGFSYKNLYHNCNGFKCF